MKRPVTLESVISNVAIDRGGTTAQIIRRIPRLEPDVAKKLLKMVAA